MEESPLGTLVYPETEQTENEIPFCFGQDFEGKKKNADTPGEKVYTWISTGTVVFKSCPQRQKLRHSLPPLQLTRADSCLKIYLAEVAT